MDSRNQLAYFCLCVFVGFIGGILYEFFAFFRTIFRCPRGKNKWLGATIDIAFCICFAMLCSLSAYWLKLPSFRLYMWIAYALGFLIYLKTLRRMVAFLQKVCYNVSCKIVKKAKNKKKLSKTGDKLI